MTNNRKRENFEGLDLSYLEDIERYEQFLLALDRHMGSFTFCTPDPDVDAIAYKRWERMCETGYRLRDMLKDEIDRFYGEKISPDAPMLGSTIDSRSNETD